MTIRAIATIVFASLLSGSGSATSGPLTISVMPLLAAAPAYLRVTSRIEPDDENRLLEITASSVDYTRTSQIPLDGARAPRVSVIDYPKLPAGIYDVSVVLIGTHGERAAVRRLVKIVPSPGQP